MRILINELRVMARIGVYQHEKLNPQELIINFSADVTEPDGWQKDDLSQWVCYETVARQITEMCSGEHIELLETMAIHIAEKLMQDKRILKIHLRIEKPRAIENSKSAGVELIRNAL